MADFLFVKIDGDFTKINYSDIIYIECLKNYVKIVTTKRTYIVLVTMKHIEERLPQDQFCRIHRSYIVALKHVDCFNSKSVNMGVKTLPLTEHHRNLLLEKVITISAEPRSRTNFGETVLLQ